MSDVTKQRPTPETDAEVSGTAIGRVYNAVHAPSVRKLERERDEATEQLRDIRSRCGIARMRLSRMVRIAWRWRNSAVTLRRNVPKWLAGETARADKAESEVARLTLAGSLFARIAAWQRETFPQGTAQSCMAHLARECEELAHALGNGLSDEAAEESADCLLLLVGIADRAGFDLLQSAEHKLAKNKGRTWGKPDAQGVVEHVRANAKTEVGNDGGRHGR